MFRGPTFVVLLFVVVHGTAGSAAAQDPTKRVHGAAVRVDVEGRWPLAGELLAADSSALWILLPTVGPTMLPLAEVREVRIARHSFDVRRIAIWTTVAGGVTTAGMLGACVSIESGGNCGFFSLAFAGAWGVVGLVSGLLVAPSSTLVLQPPQPQRIRPYARFPQGLPAGFEE
jgi:hypothetical protein